MLPPALDAAYRRSLYRVQLPTGELELRVGIPSPRLDAWLEAGGRQRWGWLTAVNPGSRQLDEAENRRRNHELAAALAGAGWEPLPGEAIDPEARWPPEPSFLVAGIGRDELVGWARRHGQLAVLTGRRGAAPRLVPTGLAPPS